MSLPFFGATSSPARPVPGWFLLRPAPLGAALVLVFNDFWLKPHHPGVVSGKLSDVALCFLFPLLIAAFAEWGLWLTRAFPRAPEASFSRALYALSCFSAAAYFTAIKLFDAGARLHVAMLSTLVPSHRFRAVADATDLVCLPLVLAAYAYLERSRARRQATR